MTPKIKWLSYVALVTLSLNSFAQKNLNIEKSPNFRTLSGITTKAGKKIKDGIIYRSGNFSTLSEKDIKVFESLNINTIVDFRNDFEIQQDPDFIPKGQIIKTKRAVIGSIDQKGMKQFMQVLNNPKFKNEDIDSLMIAANKNFVERISDFKPFFDEIAQNESVVLFHCSAGKDRTGLASSLLLHLLDVSQDEIMKDYLRSNEAVGKNNPKIQNRYGIPEERMAMLMGVKPVYLEAAWDAIQKKYGSIDSMLLTEFGIDREVKLKIQNKFLGL